MTDRTAERDAGGTERDGFSDTVEEFLRTQGSQPADANAGGAFGLDFAMKDPRTGLYAIGIECNAPARTHIVQVRSF